MEDKNNLDQIESEEIKEEKVEKKSNKRFILPAITIALSVAIVFTLGIAFGRNWGDSGDAKGTSDTTSEESIAVEEPELQLPEVLEDIVELGKIEVPNLTVDTSSIHGTEPHEVTFYFKVPDDYNKDYRAYIYEHDSGLEVCDLVREDDYFIGTAMVSGNPGETIVYNTNLSNYEDFAQITFYDEISDDSIDDLFDIADNLEKISSKYEDSKGYTRLEDCERALNYVYGEAENWLKKGDIKEVYRNSDSIFITTNAGLKIFYTPSVEGLEAGFNENNKLEITCVFPFLGNVKNALPSTNFSTAVQSISKETDKKDIVNITTYEGSSINVYNLLSCFKPNSFIVINTHGGYDRLTGPFISLTSSKSAINKEDLRNYFNDNIIHNLLFDENLNVWVSPKFFKDKLSDGCLNGSIVYLGACHSLHDNRLGREFINKGAEAVFGFTNTVTSNYDVDCFQTLATYLFTSDPYNNAKTTYPVVTAASKTKEKYPVDNKYDVSEGAEFAYMGNPNFSLFSDQAPMTHSIKLSLNKVVSDSGSSTYNFSYQYYGEKDLTGTIKPFDYDLTFSDGSQHPYNGFSYALADLDNDGNDELYLNLESDCHDSIFDLPQFSLHVFEMTDNGFTELSNGWSKNRGLNNYTISLTDDKLYTATYLEGDGLPSGDNMLYMEYIIKDDALYNTNFYTSPPANTVFQFK